MKNRGRGNGPVSRKIARAAASFSSAACAYTLFYLNRFDALQRPARREYSAARPGPAIILSPVHAINSVIEVLQRLSPPPRADRRENYGHSVLHLDGVYGLLGITLSISVIGQVFTGCYGIAVS